MRRWLSLSAALTTAAVGHLGNDTHHITGDVTLPIVSTDDPAGTSRLMTFPLQPHVVSLIRGPLTVEGSTGGRPDRALATAVILPTESDSGPHALNLPPVNPPELPGFPPESLSPAQKADLLAFLDRL